MSKDYKYTTKFSGVILASGDVDSPELNISKASLDALRSIIPSDIMLEDNVDLLAVAFNAAVVNKFNKNGDGISSQSAVRILDQFKHKPTNIEHNRDKVVGHIITSSFSKFGSNDILSKEEALASEDPFNIALGSVVYKTVNKEFADLVENSVDPDSSFYHNVSASWEIGFNDFVLAIGGEDLKDAEIISDPEEIEEYKQYLKSFDGDGKFKDGRSISRLIVGDILPLGIGFTANPAAEVKGLIARSPDENEDNFAEEEAPSIEINLEKNEKNISQNQKTTVNNIKHTIMDNQDILNDLVSALKDRASEEKFSEEAVATVTKIIKDAILEKSESFSQEKQALEEQKQKLAEATEEKNKELDDLRSQLNESIDKVQGLEVANSEREAIARFDSRMSSIEDEYDLNEDSRKIVAHELKNLDETEDSFATYQDKLAVVFKHQNKLFLKEQQEAFDAKLAEAVEKRIAELNNSEASEDEVVEEAIEKVEATEVETVANNNGESSEEDLSLRDKFKKAFSEDNLTIKY